MSMAIPDSITAETSQPQPVDAASPSPQLLPDEQSSERILITAPLGRDSLLAESVLAQAGIGALSCADMKALCHELTRGAGALLITEEALHPEIIRNGTPSSPSSEPSALELLLAALEQQPPWSDIPVILLTTGGRQTTPRSQNILDRLGPRANLTLLERPLHLRTILSTVQSALRARRRQYEVRNLVQELRRGVRQRDEFLAMLGHELRNPLAAINYSIHLLQQDNDPDPATAAQTHAVIARQTQHLARLVDDLLDVSRVTQGKVHLQKQQVDLNEIARKSVETLETAIRAQQHEVTLTTPAASTFVAGDPVRLEQVATNLLMNAIKYTPSRGHIEIQVATGGPEATLTIRDNGLGIAPELLPRVFELFTQAERSPDRAQGGLGIGLTLVHSLVTMHGGSIVVASAGLGQGSEFVVRLPLLTTSHAPSVLADPERHQLSAIEEPDTSLPAPQVKTFSEAHQSPVTPEEQSHKPPPTPAAKTNSGLHILVIEDNEDSRQILQLLLRMAGHQVEAAEDGTQGLEKAYANPPQVALVDIGLPGIDGFSVAQQLRAKFDDQIYLVALTGYGQPEDRLRTEEAGFNRHLVKPVDPQQLNDILAEIALLLH
ncbi:MAG: response regulator [Abitibacteriaceae bacterium]|nr:response regulator [Abditibacteriaceae bacterium]